MLDFVKRLTPSLAGFWPAMAAIVFVLGWRLLIVSSRPAHLRTVAMEIGSLAQFKEQGKEELFPNGDGSALVFVQETETGVGAYLWNVEGPTNKLLFEQKEKGYSWKFRILGWSPDNSLLACVAQASVDPMYLKEEFVLYDAVSGGLAARIAANGYLESSQFVWLSRNSFAYTSYNQALIVVQREGELAWAQAAVCQGLASEPLQALTSVSSRSVAWRRGGDLWMLQFDSGVPERIWESVTNTLEGFTPIENGDLLLACRDKSGPITIAISPASRKLDPGRFISGITPGDLPVRRVRLSEDNGLYSFDLKARSDDAPHRFTWHGMVESYSLGGDRLFFVGNLPNQPPGIWLYDAGTREARQLVTSEKRRLRYTKMVTPLEGMLTNAAGKHVNYHIWEPPRVAARQKYPLIIGQTHYMWFSYQQVAANGGYYFATADRISWFDGLGDWTEDVLALCATLERSHYNIDTNRIFLFATSAETAYARQLLAERPEFCKGVILIDPGALPELSNLRAEKMFLVGGKDDGSQVEGLTKYLDESAGAGIPVRTIFQDGAQHISRSIATERERTRRFAQFLVEN